jgi:hypothetical protein
LWGWFRDGYNSFHSSHPERSSICLEDCLLLPGAGKDMPSRWPIPLKVNPALTEKRGRGIVLTDLWRNLFPLTFPARAETMHSPELVDVATYRHPLVLPD